MVKLGIKSVQGMLKWLIQSCFNLLKNQNKKKLHLHRIGDNQHNLCDCIPCYVLVILRCIDL